MTSIDTKECINLSLKSTDGLQSTYSVADRHFYVITVCIYQCMYCLCSHVFESFKDLCVVTVYIPV